MTVQSWFSRPLIYFDTMFEAFMAGPVSLDVYRGWKASCLAMSGFEANAIARMVVLLLGRKSPSADMMGGLDACSLSFCRIWMRVVCL